MVSYNYCSYICELYKEFYIYRTKRPNSMSQKAGSEYEEVIITNYDPEQCAAQLNMFRMVCGAHDGEDIPYELIHTPEK